MSMSRGFFALLSLTLVFGACSAPPQTAADLANDMVIAMGGLEALEAVETLTLEGDGTRTRLGQIPVTGGEDPIAILEGVVETIDLLNGRAALDNDVINGDFSQHRTEVLTAYNGETVGWGSTVGRPNMATTPNGLFSWAMHNSPEWLLRRNVITVALWALDSASDAQLAEERGFADGTSLYGSGRIGGEDIELYFNTETGLLDGFATLDTEPMLGDVDAEYLLSDYREVGGLMLPFSLTINKEGRLFSSIDYTSIRINDAGSLEVFDVPEDIEDQAADAIASDGSWSPVTWNQVAPNVYHAVTFSHHSMVVEFPTFVAVIEGGYTEGQALTIARIIEEEIGKPIRYVAPTHPHYDHTGGIRGFASVGATVMVAAGHEAELRGIVESPHTNPPDQLALRSGAGETVGSIEVFEGMTTITEGDQTLELYESDVFAHVNPMIIAYVPGTGVIFQSDLGPTAPGPDAEALYGLAQENNWTPTTVVGGHGGTNPFTEIVTAATGN